MAPEATNISAIQSEQAVLGSILLDDSALPCIAAILDSDDFTRQDHRTIFGAILELAKLGLGIDAVTVHQRLSDQGRADDAGGLAYLGQLTRETPSAQHAQTYAGAVRDASIRRKLQRLSESISRSALARGQDAQALLDEAAKALGGLRASTRERAGLVHSRELAGALTDDLDRRRDAPQGLSIGLGDFDGHTSGLEPGDLVVVAGRPGMGKTATLVSIAAQVSQHVHVAVFSAEMPALQLMRRAVSLVSAIPQGKLRRAERLSDADWASIAPALAELAERNLWIDETPLPTLAHVRSECVALKASGDLGLVMVDYCQLVQGAGANRYEQLRDVAYGFKALAKELSVPVLLLAQLNRAVEARERKRPQLSDLRDSGAIEEAADIVGLLYSEGYYDPEFGMPFVLECAIEKNRNGERGLCLWGFSGAHSQVSVLSEGARAQYLNLRSSSRRKDQGADL